MGYSVLVIEDEENIRKIISDYFKAEGYDVIEAGDGKAGLEKFKESMVDLVVLDIMMPELDGWSVCRRIRKSSDVPIIMLTARTEEDDELMGFELKADDYVKKPFRPAVLVARAKMLLQRKSGNLQGNSNRLTGPGLELDRLSMRVELEGRSVELTSKEFDILCLLMENEGTVFSREKILNDIWGYDFMGDTRVVDNHIRKIRKALDGKAYFIKTVFGVGYKFEVR